MKEFDYVIIGGGCAGLSLAYELDLHKKLENLGALRRPFFVFVSGYLVRILFLR